MPSVKQINKQIDEGVALKSVADAFSEIAALKLQKIRASVVRNKQFSQELSELFGTLKHLAGERKHLSKALEKLIEKNSQSICIAITSNTRFYGALNKSLMDYFIKETSAKQTQRIVIGKMGIEYMKVNRINLPYDQLVFATDLPTQEELTALIQKIYPYKQILLYHSQFKTVLNQSPTMTDITGSSAAEKAAATPLADPNSPLTLGNKISTDFILEPELEKILSFFDSQILTLLVESIFLEEELSKTASRLLSMGGAQDNANNFIKEQKKLLFQAKKSVANNRLIETYVTFSRWKNTV